MLQERNAGGLVPKAATTNHDTGLLGILAVLCMIVDHTGVVFFPSQAWMRVVGRVALPLFAWGIAIGAEHTRDIRRYALRLFWLLLISQPFYMGALSHPITTIDPFASLKLNIFATLLLGLIGIWGLKEKKEWMTVLALLLAQTLSMDYGLRGVLCILLLWAVRDRPFWLAVLFSAYCVVWGDGSGSVLKTPYFDVKLQTTAILALPLMLWPSARRTKTPRWLMYAMYPGHLAVLWILKELLR